MSSLLAHLYSRIKGSPEDVATMSLCYILEKSKSARQAFTNYLSSVSGIEILPSLFFRNQVTGENNERPDLVGLDRNNNEVLLCEVKFWAGLTANQPIAYLNRLRDNKTSGDKALVFICPKDRITSLWGELLRLTNKNEASTDECINSKRTIVDGIVMTIVSWTSIISILMHILSSENSPLKDDLSQLQGLCEIIDKDAFTPFTLEDFGVDKARRIISLYNIVDKVADEMINHMGASKEGFRSTPQYAGYSRYLKLGDYGVSIRFSCEHWMTYSETPFWLSIKEIKNSKWFFAQEAREKLRDYENCIPKKLFIHDKWSELLIPLYAPVYDCEDNVASKLLEAVKEVFMQLEAS